MITQFEVSAFVASLRHAGFRLAVEDGRIVLYQRLPRNGGSPVTYPSVVEYAAILRQIEQNEAALARYLLADLPTSHMHWELQSVAHLLQEREP